MQNNPNIDNTLASKIKKLETTSLILMKNVTINGVEINTKYTDTLYYGYVQHFFTDNNIPLGKTISVIIKNWNKATHIFSTFIYANDNNALGFLSPASQTINSVSVQVIYLK